MLGVLGSAYLPAVWVSWRASPSRRRVLRWVLGVTLVVVVIGVVLIAPELALLMLVPSTLLAIAAGLVWQGGRR